MEMEMFEILMLKTLEVSGVLLLEILEMIEVLLAIRRATYRMTLKVPWTQMPTREVACEITPEIMVECCLDTFDNLLQMRGG
jgi:hypothetical protein